MSQTTPQQAVQAALQQTWTQRSRREKQLLGFGAATVMLTVLWSLAIAPAWRTWQEAPAKQARLDAQTQSMLQLQAEANSLQTPSPISRSESAAWLEKNLTELGPNARLSLQGENATLSLDAAPAEALARWISLARERALAMPVQAQLQQGAGPSLLSGTLVLRLP